VWWSERENVPAAPALFAEQARSWMIQAGANENSFCAIMRQPGTQRVAYNAKQLESGRDYRFRVEIDGEWMTMSIDGGGSSGADVFLCSIAFICAAPFEERPFILEQDFLKPFLKHEKKGFESFHSKVKISVSDKSLNNQSESVKSYIPSPKAVMNTIVNILELLNYELITFAEYCGKTNLEINSYSLDICEEMFERFCNSQGKKSWLNTFDNLV
jgi:hypothetical protein